MSDEARALYRAALRQFEGLMVAAHATDVAGRPLPLFYALAQAGHAIVASHGSAGCHSHGLTTPDPSADTSLLSVKVRPNSDEGWFQRVAAVLGSPTLNQPVGLGTLLASLPEIADETLPGATWHRPLEVRFDVSEFARFHQREVSTYVHFPEDVSTIDDFAAIEGLYPAIERSKCMLIAAEMRLPQLPRDPAGGIKVLWPLETGGPQAGTAWYRGRMWLWPALVPGEEAPSPLMTWWLVLFTLSMLARYHPVPWVAALDPDASTVAVVLERVLEEALQMLPELVLEAIMKAATPDA